MGSRVKALAVLNLLGWLIAVPILLVAVVDPFVDLDDWRDRIVGGREGKVQRRAPAPAPAAKSAPAPRR
jgi:hypothetical protein